MLQKYANKTVDRIPCRKKGDDTKGMQVIHINS